MRKEKMEMGDERSRALERSVGPVDQAIHPRTANSFGKVESRLGEESTNRGDWNGLRLREIGLIGWHGW